MEHLSLRPGRAPFSLLVGFVFTLCAPLHAETLFVDGSLPGNCSANRYSIVGRTCSGTDANGFSNFAAAFSVMQPGDTIAFRAGTYRTPMVINRSGTATAHFRFAAYNGENVTFDLAGVGSTASGIDVRSQRYLDFQGLKVVNAPLYGFRGGSNGDITIADSEFAYSYHSGIVFEGGSNISVTRSSIHHNNNGGTWHEGITFQAVDGFSITESEVYENGKEGIDAKYGSKNGIIAGNNAYRNNGPNIYLDAASDIKVSGNACHDTRSVTKACIGLSIESQANPSHFPTRNILVYNNEIWGSGAGIWFWVEAEESWAKFENVRIEYNTIIDNNTNSWGGIYFLNGAPMNYGAGNTIRNNIIVGNRWGIHESRGAISVFRVDHNLFQSGESSTTFGTNPVSTASTPFVDRAGHDYHLAPAAVARSVGVSIPDITIDIEGDPRPAINPDLGAFQDSTGGEDPPPDGLLRLRPPANPRVSPR
jgi:parallel beta-helix repeat protein